MRPSLKLRTSRFTLILLIPLTLLSLLTCNYINPSPSKPRAVRGVMDIRGWDFQKDGALRLNGEWEFYWNRLLEPSGLKQEAKGSEPGYIAVPGLWTRHKIDGKSLPGKGRATYRLRIESGPESRPKSLIVHRVLSSYRLWINGALMDKKGITGESARSREDYIFVHNKRFVSFPLREGTNEIVLQVINEDYKSGGIDWPLRLEDEEAATRREIRKYTLDMIIVGLLLFLAVYNIFYYFFRRVATSPLYIGLMSIVWAVNTYNIQSPLLTGPSTYPGNPFLINYITVILFMTLCLIMIHSLFPRDFSRGFLRFSQIMAAALTVPLFFVGFRTAERIMMIVLFLLIVYILYSLYVFFLALKRRRDDALLFFLGFIPLYLAGINNILYFLWIIDTGDALPYSMVVFCLSATLVITRRFARALHTVEVMTGELEAKNLSLEKLDRLKDQILANTSHELRTPLHGMIGLTESLLEGSAGSLPPKARENLALIASSGHRLTSMVNDLLDMARIQNEGLHLNLRPVDMRALCDMVVRLTIPLTGDRPVEIINGIPKGIPPVRADEDRIRQVLHNLLGNAIKFTNRGTIEVSARILQGEEGTDIVEVSVSDTGIGIPEEFREKIFETYRQVDGSDNRSYSGMGLGLAIARQIIELHGGGISVCPRTGGGSVFTFTLPISREALPAASSEIRIEGLQESPADQAAPDESRLPAGISESVFDENPVLLVVDDDPVNIRIIQNYFEAKQCVVKTACDGINALDIIEGDDTLDLVLLDIMMPVMSGYEVCRRIRLNRTPEELPVIMLTAKNMMADINAAFKAGANDYIVKPFQLSELLARVSTMLKLRSIRKSPCEGITIRGGNNIYSLTFNEIIHITSHSKNVVIHTDEKQIELPVMLKEIIDRLPPDMFIRIHKSHVINIQYVQSMSHVLSGRYRVRLRDSDDTELPVGSAFLDTLRKKM